MSVAVNQPWLFDVPATEPKRVKTKWEELSEMAQVSGEVGGLVPPSVGCTLLDVSRQRVYDLMSMNRFEVWEFFGSKYISIRDVKAYMEGERKSGRPCEVPDSKQMWKRAMSVSRECVEAKRKKKK